MNGFQKEVQDYRDRCHADAYENGGHCTAADLLHVDEEGLFVTLGAVDHEVGYVTRKNGAWEITDLIDGLADAPTTSLWELCQHVGSKCHDAWWSLPGGMYEFGPSMSFALSWAAGRRTTEKTAMHCRGIAPANPKAKETE